MDEIATQTGGARVVALVSSVGGLDALTRVLAPLPANFPAAVIALQHQMPEQPSHLTEILGTRCALSVVVAEHGMPLAPCRVHVAPPGRHVLLRRDDTLALIVSGAFPPNRPSADLLLLSLAVVAGPRTIAVVLSGKGNDGATGATAVHDFGGVVIAADQLSSEEFSMPAATIGRRRDRPRRGCGPDRRRAPVARRFSTPPRIPGLSIGCFRPRTGSGRRGRCGSQAGHRSPLRR
jgi:two-component system chemotaxis response regulator CheB